MLVLATTTSYDDRNCIGILERSGQRFVRVVHTVHTSRALQFTQRKRLIHSIPFCDLRTNSYVLVV